MRVVEFVHRRNGEVTRSLSNCKTLERDHRAARFHFEAASCNHYDTLFGLQLTDRQKADLAEYLKTL